MAWGFDGQVRIAAGRIRSLALALGAFACLESQTPALQASSSSKASSRFDAKRSRQLQAVHSPQAILNSYCVTCHNQRLKTAGLLIDALDVANVQANTDRWEQIVRKLRAGTMPPPGAPRPDAAT